VFKLSLQYFRAPIDNKNVQEITFSTMIYNLEIFSKIGVYEK